MNSVCSNLARSLVAFAADDGKISVFELNEGAFVLRYHCTAGSRLRALSFSGTEERVFVSATKDRIQWWEVPPLSGSTSARDSPLEITLIREVKLSVSVSNHPCLCVNPLGQSVALFAGDNSLLLVFVCLSSISSIFLSRFSRLCFEIEIKIEMRLTS